MIVGNEGILKKASDAKKEYEEAVAKEKQDLQDLQDIYSNIIVGTDGTITIKYEDGTEKTKKATIDDIVKVKSRYKPKK